MQNSSTTKILSLSEARLGKVISNYFWVFIFVLILFSISLCVVCAFRTKCPKLLSEKYRILFVIIGTGLLLVAGIGRLGWSIQTYGGNTLAENLNTWIFWIISCLGTLLLFVDINVRLLDKMPGLESKIRVVVVKTGSSTKKVRYLSKITASTILELIKRTERWLSHLGRRK